MVESAAVHEIPIRLRVNGREVEARIETDVLLIELLRDRLGLTGTKESCGVGVCGACTVLVDGGPVSSCLSLAVVAAHRDVWTVEGLADRVEEADPSGTLRDFLDVRRAFLEHEGVQCGSCTPGVVVSAYALLQKIPRPTNEEIADWMAGSLCRCTGYPSIVRSIRAAAGLPPTEDAQEEDPVRGPGDGPRGSRGAEGADAPV